MIQQKGTLFINRVNFECGNSFFIPFFDICQVQGLQFIIMFLFSIENRITIFQLHYENVGSAKTTRRKIFV